MTSFTLSYIYKYPPTHTHTHTHMYGLGGCNQPWLPVCFMGFLCVLAEVNQFNRQLRLVYHQPRGQVYHGSARVSLPQPGLEVIICRVSFWPQAVDSWCLNLSVAFIPHTGKQPLPPHPQSYLSGVFVRGSIWTVRIRWIETQFLLVTTANSCLE